MRAVITFDNVGIPATSYAVMYMNRVAVILEEYGPTAIARFSPQTRADALRYSYQVRWHCARPFVHVR